MYETKAIDHTLEHARLAQQQTERMIMATPTSPKRDYLTEANMHLLMAHDALTKASQTKES